MKFSDFYGIVTVFSFAALGILIAASTPTIIVAGLCLLGLACIIPLVLPLLLSTEPSTKRAGRTVGHAYGAHTSAAGTTSSIKANCIFAAPVTSLKDVHKILPYINDGDYISIENEPINSDVLGLLLIKGLKAVYVGRQSDALVAQLLESLESKNEDNPFDKPTWRRLAAFQIINRHLARPAGKLRMYECQAELINANLEEFARL